MAEQKRYWVVSPNVRDNEPTAPEWKRASVLRHAAFMGYGPNDRTSGKGAGYKFAHEIMPGHIVLIARRHHNEPDAAGFGIVKGQFGTSVPIGKTPDSFGSYRNLQPFVSLVGIAPQVPIEPAIGQTSALAELHLWRSDHKRICEWMENELTKAKDQHAGEVITPRERKRSIGARQTDASENSQLDYLVHTRKQVKRAVKREERLMQRYRDWLATNLRALPIVVYADRFRCDGYEVVRRNLIEAKSSAKREYVRMAVGQLLDYAYLGKDAGYKPPNLAILLPERPIKQIEAWLGSLSISVIWPKKKSFFDNAGGQFV